MTTDEQRRERVRQGSRRKRDLAVVDPRFDSNAWVAEHLPNEHYGFAVVAAGAEYLKRPAGTRRPPTREEVEARLKATNRHSSQLEGPLPTAGVYRR